MFNLAFVRKLFGRSPKTIRNARPSPAQPRARLGLEVLEDRLLMSAGSLDTTFGNGGGRATADFQTLLGPSATASAVVAQPDGKIIIAGTVASHILADTSSIAVVRLMADGTLDRDFAPANGGRQSIDFWDLTGGSHDRVSAVALDPQGRIVITGTSDTANGTTDFAVARLNTDGSFDTSFGLTGGRAVFRFSSSDSANNEANALAIDPQGRIVVAGSLFGPGTSYFAVGRLNTNGSFDTSFGIGSSGRQLVSFKDLLGGSDDHANAVALDSQGRIVVAGTATTGDQKSDFAVARLNTDGSFDTTFGIASRQYFTFSDILHGNLDYANAVAIDGQDRIVVAGTGLLAQGGSSDFAVARLNADGWFDTSFGQSGRQYFTFSDMLDGNNMPYGNQDEANAVTIDTRGRIIVAGEAFRAPNKGSDFAVARLTTDGSFDTPFGQGGRETFNFNDLLGGTADLVGTANHASAVALDAQGRIFVAGSVYTGGNTNFAVGCLDGGATAIWNKYSDLLLAGHPIGYPLAAEMMTPDGSIHWQQFSGGTIYSSLATGAHEVEGPILAKYLSKGGPNGPLGLPISDQTVLTDGVGQASHFQYGSIFSSPDTGTWEVHGYIHEEYYNLGFERGYLGYPTSDEITTPDGLGQFNTFQHGSIYWSPDTGAAHAIQALILDKWASLGWEQGILGYPTSSTIFRTDGSFYNNFQHGTIVWTPSPPLGGVGPAGASAIYGPIWTKWMSLGGMNSGLGNPQGEVAPTGYAPGQFLHFANNASIYWSQTTQAWVVQGGIRDKWASLGWEKLLGFPTSDQTIVNGFPTSTFENGTIVSVGVGTIVQFDRNQMIGLLSRLAWSGTVQADDLQTVKNLLADYTWVQMPEYVRNLANKVVNGNRANALYQEGPLGNLAAGSNPQQLSLLISKWFLGGDVPVAEIGDGLGGWMRTSYAMANGTLFGSSGPVEYDVNQGDLGDCYFLATLGEVALRDPNLIKGMFIDNGDGTFTVRFYDSGQADYVTVNRNLPVDSAGNFLFANRDKGKVAWDSSNVLWVALAEKAYVQMNESGWIGEDGTNSYQGIAAGWSEFAFGNIVGRETHSNELENFWGNYLDDMIIDWRNGRMITLDTYSSQDDVPNGLLANSHTYVLVDVSNDDQQFTVYNPWATDGRPGNNGIDVFDRHEILVNFKQWTWCDGPNAGLVAPAATPLADVMGVNFALTAPGDGSTHHLLIQVQTDPGDGTNALIGLWDGQKASGTLSANADGTLQINFGPNAGAGFDGTISGTPGQYTIAGTTRDTQANVVGNGITAVQLVGSHLTVAGNQVTVTPGAASLQVAVDGMLFTLDPGAFSSIDVTGAGANSTLTIDDRTGPAVAGAKVYSVDGNVVSVSGLLINFGTGLQNVVLQTSDSSSSEVDVTGTAPGNALQIEAGAAATTVNAYFDINNGAVSEQLLGNVTVLGNAQTVLNTFDLALTPQNYTLQADSISQDGRGTVSYVGVGTVAVTGGNGKNLFIIEGTAAGTVTTVNGGSGGDHFVVQDLTNYNMDNIHGVLNIHGGPLGIQNYAYVELYDYFNQSAQTFDFTANSVTRTGLAPIYFDGLCQVSLYTAGYYPNTPTTINVEGVAANLFLDLAVENGDKVNIGQPVIDPVTGNVTGTLANILGAVDVNALAGTQTVVVDDSADQMPRNATTGVDGNGVYLEGLAPGTLYFSMDPASTLQLKTGPGGVTGLDAFYALLGQNNPFGLAAQTISFAGLADATYGAGPITLNATTSSGLAVSYQVLSGPATLSGNVLTLTGAGLVTVEASQAGDGTTYNAATPVDQSFTVHKAHLTVAADNQMRLYGQADPTFTATLTGFQNGDTLATSGVTGAIAFSSPDTAASPVGTYAITADVSELQAANYDFTAVNGQLTVTVQLVGTHLTVAGNQVTVIPGAAGLAVAVDGQVFEFDPGAISSIDVTGAGTNSTLTVNDRTGPAVAGTKVYSVDGNVVSVSGLSINFGTGFQNVVLQTSDSSASEVDVTGTAPGVALQIEAGAAATTVNAYFDSTNGTVSEQLLGNVAVLGNAQTVLNTFDVSSTPQSYTLLAGSVSEDGRGTVSYVGVGTVAVTGGNGKNLFIIESTAAGTVTTINGGTGGDQFVVYDLTTYNMDNIHGVLNIHGNDPIEPQNYACLELYDYFNQSAQTFDFTTGMVTRTGIAPIHFDGLYEVTLWTSGYSANTPTTINVESVAATDYLNLAVEDGDTVNIGDGTGTLDSIGGFVQVDALGGTQTVVVDDSADLTPRNASTLVDAYGVWLEGLAPGQFAFSMDPASTLQLKTGPGGVTGLDAFSTLLSQNNPFGLAAQTVAFAGLADATYGDGPITLDATASSGLAVSYQVLSGPATLSGSVLTITGAGLVTVEASQAGDGTTYNAATPVDQSFTVHKAHLSVTADDQTRLYGQADPAFTATLTGFQNGETLATSGVSGAIAFSSTDTAASPVGTYTITAAQGTLAADNYDFATFVAGSLTVNKAGTTVALQTSINSATVGQQITFTGTVTAVSPGVGVPSGTVTFMDGNTVLGTGTLSNGVVTFQTATLAAGNHSITAVYGGDGNFTANTSTALTQTVKQAATTVALTSSASPAVFGQSITLTAKLRVVAPGAGLPSGTVTFKDGNTVLGTGTISNDVVTFQTAKLAVGTHSITAVYGGDGNFMASTSVALSQSVNQAATTVTLTSSASTALFKQLITLTATIGVVAPGAGLPSGTVTFLDGTTVLGTGTISNGVVTFQTAKLSKGKHTLTVVYSGDSNFTGSTSTALIETIN